jgi:glutamate--cysteine ligase catalytic subunit
MKRAHTRDAIHREKFHFRRQIKKCPQCPLQAASEAAAAAAQNELEFEEMSMAEIFVGKSVARPGLIPLVQSYLDIIQCDVHTRAIVDNYIELVRARAEGRLQTAATYMREFIRAHEGYMRDSVVTPAIARDLIDHCDRVAHRTAEVGFYRIVRPG